MKQHTSPCTPPPFQSKAWPFKLDTADGSPQRQRKRQRRRVESARRRRKVESARRRRKAQAPISPKRILLPKAAGVCSRPVSRTGRRTTIVKLNLGSVDIWCVDFIRGYNTLHILNMVHSLPKLLDCRMIGTLVENVLVSLLKTQFRFLRHWQKKLIKYLQKVRKGLKRGHVNG